MVSVAVLQAQLFRLFTLAYKDGLQLKVHYKDRVYMITVEPTGESYRRTNYKKSKGQKVGIQLETHKCKTCKSLIIANICVNGDCPSNANRPKHRPYFGRAKAASKPPNKGPDTPQ